MIGFLIGTACLLGLMKVIRRGRCHGYGYGGGCGGGMRRGWGGHGGHGPWDGHEGGRWGGGDAARWMLRGLFERLDTTPGQEKVILQAVEGLREQMRAGREALHATGGHAAKAFRGERFDESAMADAFTKQDAALESAQKALFEALAKVHEALDERQRREFAELLERGVGPWSRWGAAPYRA